MQENGDIEQANEPKVDAVDVLDDFMQRHCDVAIGREFQTQKPAFQSAFVIFCKERGIEPPSNGLLGTLLVKLFPAVWSDALEFNGVEIPVWRNLILKEMPVTKNKGVR